MTMNIPVKLLRNPMYAVRWLDWQFRRRVQKTLTVQTKQGLFTVFSVDNSIGKSLYCYGEYETEWVQQVISFLREQGRLSQDDKRTVLDIGANMGVISISLLNAGLMDKAIAIEPDPKNFALLRRNVRQNGLAEYFVCLQYAVSDRDGVLKFELSENNYGDHRVRRGTGSVAGDERYHESRRVVIDVPAAKLDRLIKFAPAGFVNSLALVWIDVQGYEGYAFNGGERLFARNIPVQAEIWPYGIRRAGMNANEFCDIANRLWNYYWVLEKGKFVCFPISNLYKLFNQLGTAGTFSNVIFMHD